MYGSCRVHQFAPPPRASHAVWGPLDCAVPGLRASTGPRNESTSPLGGIRRRSCPRCAAVSNTNVGALGDRHKVDARRCGVICVRGDRASGGGVEATKLKARTLRARDSATLGDKTTDVARPSHRPARRATFARTTRRENISPCCVRQRCTRNGTSESCRACNAAACGDGGCWFVTSDAIDSSTTCARRSHARRVQDPDADAGRTLRGGLRNLHAVGVVVMPVRRIPYAHG